MEWLTNVCDRLRVGETKEKRIGGGTGQLGHGHGQIRRVRERIPALV